MTKEQVLGAGSSGKVLRISDFSACGGSGAFGFELAEIPGEVHGWNCVRFGGKKVLGPRS